MRALRMRGKALGVVAALAGLTVFAAVAFADNVQNDVVIGGNDTITAGGSTTINYRITANSGDGQTGCNAADASSAVVTINTPAGVTATPSSLTFTSCGTTQSVVFSSSAVGTHEITASVVDSGTGTYNTNPAKFDLVVNAATLAAPTVQGALNPSTPDGLAGWYVNPPVLTWTIGGGASTLSGDCADNGLTRTLTGDVGETTLTCTATNATAPNGVSASVTYKLDSTDPTIDITTPAEGASYTLNQSVSAAFSCADVGGSLVASCIGSVANGAAIDTTTIGAKSVTVNAADNAGNTNSDTNNYGVIWDFDGFFSPVDNGGVYNKAKAGSAIPVKFDLGGNQGLDIMDGDTPNNTADDFPKSQVIPCDTTAELDGIEATVNAGGSSLTYDTFAGQYIYVWKTDKSWANAPGGPCRQLVLTLDDGESYRANFKFFK